MSISFEDSEEFEAAEDLRRRFGARVASCAHSVALYILSHSQHLLPHLVEVFAGEGFQQEILLIGRRHCLPTLAHLLHLLLRLPLPPSISAHFDPQQMAQSQGRKAF